MDSMIRARLAFLVAGALAACGGSATTSGGSSGGPGAGSGSLSGTVAGSSFNVTSALAADYSAEAVPCPTADGGPPQCYAGNVFIGLASRGPDVCPAVSSTSTNTVTELANVDSLELTVVNVNGQVTAGTYDVAPSGDTSNPSPLTSAVFSTTTSTCAGGVSLGATGGTITLTEVSAARLAGTYGVTFDTQGSFSGTFDVPICPLAPPTQASSVPPRPPVVVCE
jgi:hypothetical protein